AEGAQRVVDGVEHRARGTGHATLAGTLEAALGVGGGRLYVGDPDVGQLGGHGDEVVHHRGREQLSPVVVDAVLPERVAEAVGDAATDLLVDQHRVDHPAPILDT